MPDGRTWFTVAEAAERLGIRSDNVLRAIQRGTLRATRPDIGLGQRNPWRIARADLDAWQARQAHRHRRREPQP